MAIVFVCPSASLQNEFQTPNLFLEWSLLTYRQLLCAYTCTAQYSLHYLWRLAQAAVYQRRWLRGVWYTAWSFKVALSPWPSLRLHLPDRSRDEGSPGIENAGHICLSGIRLFLKYTYIHRQAHPIASEVTERCGWSDLEIWGYKTCLQCFRVSSC